MKQSILVEADGGPLAITIGGANILDAQLLEATIDAIVLERPDPEPDFPQRLCLDKGYDNDTGWEAAIDAGYDPHIAVIRDERPPRPKRYKPRRWVVERTFAWISHNRRMAKDYERLCATGEGFVYAAMTRLMVRRLTRA